MFLRFKIRLIKKDNQKYQNLKEFFLKGKQYRFKRGQIILRPDIESSGIYFIEKGYIRVYYLTESGREKLHIIYKDGDFFPLLWVLRGIHKDAYYEAMIDVVCRKIETKEFLVCIKENLHLLYELNQKLLDYMNVFVNRVDTLETPKSYYRVVAMLLFLSKRFGRGQDRGIIIDAPVTHKDIADSIALNRESVSREIEILFKKGLLAVKSHKFFIPDRKKLEKELLKC